MKALLHVGLMIPVEGDPQTDVGLMIDGTEITDVGAFEKVKSRHPGVRVVDLQDNVVTPGLVNAHAHLELTDLRHKVKWRGDFADWIRQILPHKMSWSTSDFMRQIDHGIDELVASGTTTIGDHTTQGYSFSRMRSKGVRGVAFWEVVMFNPEHAPGIMTKIDQYLKKGNHDRVTKGIAIHAPYSVCPEIIRWAAKKGKKVPVSTHVSELKEEIDFVLKDNEKNIFRVLSKQRGMWNPAWSAPKVSPVAYFKSLGLKRYLGVHGNYIKKGDLEIHESSRNSIVYCPLSHAYFKHPKWPMSRYMSRDFVLGIGTDSCASNKVLDMRSEMSHIKKTFPKMSDHKILEMATLGGATVLGLNKAVGSIKKGKKADLVFFKTSKNAPLALKGIVQKRARVTSVMCDGRWLKKP